MLAALVRFSLRFRGVVVALAVLLLAYGTYALQRAGLDIFPEFSPNLVIIQTESAGLSAEQVELLVSQPIENALGGLIGLDSIRSESIQGLSIVTVVFKEGTDVYRNRQLVSERLAGLAGVLPESVATPVAVPLSSSSATILTIGVRNADDDLMALRDLVDWTIKPRILSVAGVADVNVFGGDQRKLQIQIDPQRLVRHGLGMADVVTAAAQATGVVGAGFIENRNQRLTLQIAGQPLDAQALRAVVLTAGSSGNHVLLGDVAEIRMAAAAPIGAAALMAEPGVVMMIIGQRGANTLTVSRAVEAALEDLGTVLEDQGVTLYPQLFRPANYIEASLDNIGDHLVLGGAFVLLVLFLFLFNLRTALISAVAIPLSLISACLLLLELGVNLNVMVIGGLAIALGEVVDDAIIDTENIFRRLRENRLLGMPRPAGEVIFEASMEVRGSVVYASFIVALVFVPLLTLGGVSGRLFAPLGSAYILAILASLLTALTVTPALCYLLLAKGDYRADDPPLIKLLKPSYERGLGVLLRHSSIAIVISLLLCLAGLSILPALGTRFLPELREGHYIVHTSSMPGTSLQESIRIGNRLTEQFLQIPGVRSVSQWAGRAERGADTFGSHYSEFEVDLEPLSGREQQQVLERLRAVLDDFPGILYEANTFLIERVDETISGYTSPVVINVYGSELETLDRLAQGVASVMRDTPGATDVQLRSPPGTPLALIRLRQGRLSRAGLRPVAVMNAIQVAYEGRVVGRAYAGNRPIEVAVVLHPDQRQALEQIGQLPIRTASGKLIPLSQLADIQQSGGRYNILRRNAQRLQTVTCNVAGRPLSKFITDLERRVLAQIHFPPGTYPEFTGAALEGAQARQDLILHSLIVGVGVLMLIYIAIGSLRHMLLMLVNLPFSLVGGVVAVLLTGATLSVGSLVGFVTLFGITVRNSIMLVSHYQHLVAEEEQIWSAATALRGARERLPSILMTALVTALAMLPIAMDSDNAGREIMGPMAAIIIGGLASSTLLNLLILPSIMLRFGRFKPAG